MRSDSDAFWREHGNDVKVNSRKSIMNLNEESCGAQIGVFIELNRFAPNNSGSTEAH